MLYVSFSEFASPTILPPHKSLPPHGHLSPNILTTPETLSAIGKALGIDSGYLMRLAGIPIPPPATQRSSTAEYIARQLDDLPPYLQEHAFAAVATLVDTFRLLAEGKTANGEKLGEEAALNIRGGVWLTEQDLAWLRELRQIFAEAHVETAQSEQPVEDEDNMADKGGKGGKSNSGTLDERYDSWLAKVPDKLKKLFDAEQKEQRPKPRDFEMLPQRKLSENPA